MKIQSGAQKCPWNLGTYSLIQLGNESFGNTVLAEIFQFSKSEEELIQTKEKFISIYIL